MARVLLLYFVLGEIFSECETSHVSVLKDIWYFWFGNWGEICSILYGSAGTLPLPLRQNWKSLYGWNDIIRRIEHIYTHTTQDMLFEWNTELFLVFFRRCFWHKDRDMLCVQIFIMRCPCSQSSFSLTPESALFLWQTLPRNLVYRDKMTGLSFQCGQTLDTELNRIFFM